MYPFQEDILLSRASMLKLSVRPAFRSPSMRHTFIIGWLKGTMAEKLLKIQLRQILQIFNSSIISLWETLEFATELLGNTLDLGRKLEGQKLGSLIPTELKLEIQSKSQMDSSIDGWWMFMLLIQEEWSINSGAPNANVVSIMWLRMNTGGHYEKIISVDCGAVMITLNVWFKKGMEDQGGSFTSGIRSLGKNGITPLSLSRSIYLMSLTRQQKKKVLSPVARWANDNMIM